VLTLSLGFSCLTRFSIEQVSADHRRFPFDYAIATRKGVIEALDSHGGALQVEPDALSVFTTATEGREGPTQGEFYYWHDYPMGGVHTLAEDWRKAVPEVNARYRYLWDRFDRLVTDPGTTKRFVVSNAQHNLPDFASAEAFDTRFALDTAYYVSLTEALDRYGIADYRVVFLNRDIAHTVETRAGVSDPRFSTRFVGVLNLPTHHRIASSALGPAAPPEGRIARACGRYEGGWRLEPSGPVTATVYRDGASGAALVGEFCETMGGFLAVLANAPNQVFRVMDDGGDLRFAGRVGGEDPRWRRLGD
jgi:hypothetical protein